MAGVDPDESYGAPSRSERKYGCVRGRGVGAGCVRLGRVSDVVDVEFDLVFSLAVDLLVHLRPRVVNFQFTGVRPREARVPG